MSENNHSLDTEYKGGAISPPPNKVDLDKIQEILDKAKSIGYIGITDIPLLPKHKKESFEPIPLCIPPVTQLLKSLGLKVLDGSGIAKESEKKKEELIKAIEEMSKMTETMGKIGSGISNINSNIADTVKHVAGQFLGDKNKDTVEIINTVTNNLKDFNTGNNQNPKVVNLAKIPFIDFSPINVKEKKISTRSEILIRDPEAIITESSLDRETEESTVNLDLFEKRFDEIKSKLLSNLDSYPEKLKSQYFNALTNVDVGRSKDQLFRTANETKPPVPFGGKIEIRKDVPKNWLPEYPEGV